VQLTHGDRAAGRRLLRVAHTDVDGVLVMSAAQVLHERVSCRTTRKDRIVFPTRQ
jgi:hypothetical protein